jgi:hypothetical protein
MADPPNSAEVLGTFQVILTWMSRGFCPWGVALKRLSQRRSSSGNRFISAQRKRELVNKKSSKKNFEVPAEFNRK